MSEFVKATTIDKIHVGKKIKVEVKNNEIMLANVDGKIYAIENICSHEQCGLDEGDLNGFVITCSCHGAKYDVRNGNGFKETPWGSGQESFEVKVKGNDVFVKI
jgi:nitrite reductase/ring-hydroxylating ferredoxin subunit